ncbi:MAG: hypothetical protein K2P78_15200 [Gemmataceae bacterium]|nr:hypothetical protein [Gemmataceae bacterium]
MGYGEFTLKDVKARFGVETDEYQDLFAAVPPVAPSDLLRGTLDRALALAVAISTEKAKSELITAPVLLDVWSTLRPRVSLFSGNEFPVDPARGLTGYCDYILSRSHEQHYITAPVMVIVEAKNDLPVSGFGQCAAAMVAARLFNDREGSRVPAVYGACTSGTVWRFLRLDGAVLAIDRKEYYIDQVGQILGILHHILREPAAPAAAA